MPYGIPWGMVTFRCVSCGKEYSYDAYRPYCGLCGARQPDESEMKSQGLIGTSSASENIKYTHDINEINQFLHNHRGKRTALWGYSVSHGELEIRLAHSGGPNLSDEPWLNTLILCSATESIQMPELGWSCNLMVEVRQNIYKTPNGQFSLNYYLLIDKPAKIQIQCGSVGMYFDVKPGL